MSNFSQGSILKSILEYPSPVWSPSTEYILEMVQRREARFVLNGFLRYSSVSRMSINQLGLPMLKLYDEELKLKFAMMHKILNNLVFMDHDLPNQTQITQTKLGAIHAI